MFTPGRYPDFKQTEDDGVGFEKNMKELTKTLKEQMQKAVSLDSEIKKNL